MSDIFDLHKEKPVLNPNCSELIGALKIKTDQEFKAVIEELRRVATLELYLNIGHRTAQQLTSLAVKKDKDGITRLILAPLDWKDYETRTEVDCKIPVPLDYLCLKEGILDLNPHNADIVFSEIVLKASRLDGNIIATLENDDFTIKQQSNRSGEGIQLLFKEARLDLSLLRRLPTWRKPYFFSVEIEGLKFKYNSKAKQDFLGNSFLDGFLFTMIFDTDLNLFPVLRKIVRSFAGRYINSITSYDGGTSQWWEKWCAENFAEYYIEEMGDSSIHEKGSLYLLPADKLADFKSFISDLYSVGMKVIVWDEKIKLIEPGSIEKLDFIDGEVYVVHRLGKDLLDKFRILPAYLDLDLFLGEDRLYMDQGNSYKISYYPRDDQFAKSLDQLTFYIYVSKYSTDYLDQGAEKFEPYLSKNSKIVRI